MGFDWLFLARQVGFAWLFAPVDLAFGAQATLLSGAPLPGRRCWRRALAATAETVVLFSYFVLFKTTRRSHPPGDEMLRISAPNSRQP